MLRVNIQRNCPPEELVRTTCALIQVCPPIPRGENKRNPEFVVMKILKMGKTQIINNYKQFKQ